MSGQDVDGRLTADSERDVIAMLAQRALCPLHVKSLENQAGGFRFQRAIKGELLSATLTQLSDLLENGVPLLRSLEVLVEQTEHPGLRKVLGDIRGQVSEGRQIDVAMAAHPRVFNDLVISIIRAGVEGAFLEQALRQTSEFLERQEELRSRIRSAMAYPAFLAGAGSIVVLVLIVFFVPKFAELFAQLEEAGTLPAATIALLWLSDTLGRYGILIAMAFGGGIYGIGRWAASDRGRQLIDQWKVRLPLFGSIFLNSSVSRVCRILGTLLNNGVPLLRALQISSDSAGNVILGDAVRTSAENVSSGEPLSAPLAACGLFPPNIMAMITIAEEANNLETVLNKIADGLDRKNERLLDTMVRLIEPALLFVMGGVVLFVIVALLLPVFEMSPSMG